MTVPVPTYTTCPGADGFSFSVHEQVPGIALERDLWLGFPDDVRGRLARDVGGFLRGLHTLDVAVGRACGVQALDHHRNVSELRDRIGREPGSLLPEPLRAKLEDSFRRFVSGGVEWSYTPALLHADVSPGHVLINVARAEITGVIDWGDAGIGDPARDFIFLYEDWGTDFLHLALQAYAHEDAERMLARVHLLYLANQLDWTLRAGEAGRSRELENGITALEEGVIDFEGSVG